MDQLKDVYKQGRNQLKTLTNKQYAANLFGQSLEDLARACTAKTLSGRDPQANEAFVSALETSSDADDRMSKELLNVLKRRLAMDNVHKQWLAILLVSDVLERCPNALTASGRQEILGCVAEVAKHPSNKTQGPHGETLVQSIRKAKQASLELLRTSGGDGQAALRQVAGLGGAAEVQRALQQSMQDHQGGNGGQRSWEALARDTTTAIETVKSHSELVNELLLAEGAGEFEMGITMEVMSEMMTFSQTFEPLLAQLASFETPESEALLAQALEAFDLIGSCQQLQSDVIEARTTGCDGSEQFSPSNQPQAHEPKATPSAQDAFDALGLGELQLAMNETLPAASQDPFMQMAGKSAAAPVMAYPFASSQPPQPNPNNPFAQQSSANPFAQAAGAPPGGDPFVSLATGSGPFSSQAHKAQQPPQTNPFAPSSQPQQAVDPFAALASPPPAPSAAPVMYPFLELPGPPPPAPTAAPIPSPPPAPAPTHVQPAAHLSPQVLLQDLTKAPKSGGLSTQGLPMKAAGSSQSGTSNPFSATNPFASAEATAPPPFVSPTAADDEWDKFFKDRVTGQ